MRQGFSFFHRCLTALPYVLLVLSILFLIAVTVLALYSYKIGLDPFETFDIIRNKEFVPISNEDISKISVEENYPNSSAVQNLEKKGIPSDDNNFTYEKTKSNLATENVQSNQNHGILFFLKDTFGIKMKHISAGTFRMGSLETEFGRLKDEKSHIVRISSDFWIGVYPVTQDIWKNVMKEESQSRYQGDDFPVENITWFEAVEFCDKLNQLTQNIRPTAYRFSLPTEAQWEYACRAGSRSEYYRFDPDEICWHNGNAFGHPHRVGTKRPNDWGLHDMSGNVWEWCLDWYGEYPGNSTVDPVGNTTGNKRVIRGGSWASGKERCRSATRGTSAPDKRYGNCGFRIVLSKVQ